MRHRATPTSEMQIKVFEICLLSQALERFHIVLLNVKKNLGVVANKRVPANRRVLCNVAFGCERGQAIDKQSDNRSDAQSAWQDHHTNYQRANQNATFGFAGQVEQELEAQVLGLRTETRGAEIRHCLGYVQARIYLLLDEPVRGEVNSGRVSDFWGVGVGGVGLLVFGVWLFAVHPSSHAQVLTFSTSLVYELGSACVVAWSLVGSTGTRSTWYQVPGGLVPGSYQWYCGTQSTRTRY
jgi:hypothetical protein